RQCPVTTATRSDTATRRTRLEEDFRPVRGRSKLHFQTTAFDHSFRIFVGGPATLPIAQLSRAIPTADDDDEDSKKNRRLLCASARDGTAGPDMAITRVDSRGLVPGAGAATFRPPSNPEEPSASPTMG
ncbi:uncharacterized protein LOC113563553, partial [Ooceraea biroi]|uniref:uncharacterized protein LOC113563553 n=1 Tax=Ooceraea biroi TaxID=2015173 RepID=UPI000F08A486